VVESLVSLGIKAADDYDSCFSDIVVSCNTYGGETFAQGSYSMGELQTKYENILFNVFASFAYGMMYILQSKEFFWYLLFRIHSFLLLI
jgi:hypothetical protein